MEIEDISKVQFVHDLNTKIDELLVEVKSSEKIVSAPGGTLSGESTPGSIEAEEDSEILSMGSGTGKFSDSDSDGAFDEEEVAELEKAVHPSFEAILDRYGLSVVKSVDIGGKIIQVEVKKNDKATTDSTKTLTTGHSVSGLALATTIVGTGGSEGSTTNHVTKSNKEDDSDSDVSTTYTYGGKY